MSSIYKLTERVDPLDEASQWLARLDRGLDVQEEQCLREWLTADPRNPAALIEVASVWDKMDTLARLAELFPRPAQPREASVYRSWIWVTSAASLLLAILAGLWITIGNSAGELQAGGEVFETAVGQSSTAALPDGSRLTLNTSSRVRVEFTQQRRTLVLERGELYVQVARDESRPLSVRAGNRVVQALGTAFNVRITEDRRIELIVTEGKVLVGLTDKESSAVQQQTDSNTAPALALSGGQRIVLGEEHSDREGIEPLKQEEIEVRLSWRSGNLVFRGEPLGVALAQIERYTPVEFVIQDEDLKKVRVIGIFKAGDVEGLLTTLRENFDIAYQRVGDKEVILTSKSAR